MISSYISRDETAFLKSTGDSEENHHFIWHLGPSCVAKQSREHFKCKQGVHLTPSLERNASWSRRTASLRSLRQRKRPKSRGDSEENHHFIWHLGPTSALPNATENCARCERGVSTLSGEVNVRFIVLLSLFDRTQGRIRGG